MEVRFALDIAAVSLPFSYWRDLPRVMAQRRSRIAWLDLACRRAHYQSMKHSPLAQALHAHPLSSPPVGSCVGGHGIVPRPGK